MFSLTKVYPLPALGTVDLRHLVLASEGAMPAHRRWVAMRLGLAMHHFRGRQGQLILYSFTIPKHRPRLDHRWALLRNYRAIHPGTIPIHCRACPAGPKHWQGTSPQA